MTKDNQPTVEGDLRKKVIQFQKDTLAEWANPAGKNVDMIKLAYKFADELQAIANTKEIVTSMSSSPTLEWYLEQLPRKIKDQPLIINPRTVGTSWFAGYVAVEQFAIVDPSDKFMWGEGKTPLEAVRALCDKLKGEEKV